jgi:peptidoglycan/LPS O-acetylase OafA/YrhL
MIQRIQTLYLLAALSVNIIFMFAPLASDAQNKRVFADHTFTLALGVLTSVGLLYSIFLFSNRKRQMLACKMVGVATLSELAVALFGFTLNSSSGFSSQSWGTILPLSALVMIYLAYRAINRDEKLVRSADRLR